MAETFDILRDLKNAGKLEINPLGIDKRFTDEEKIIVNVARTQKDQKLFGGGPIQKFSDALLISNYGQVALAKKILEGTGFLPDSRKSIKDIMDKRMINSDLLLEIGKETGQGGVLTGQYKKTQNVFHNFLRELPRVTIGTAADIIADPLTWLAGVGIVRRATAGLAAVLGKGIRQVPKGAETLSFMNRTFNLPSRRRSPELNEAIVRRKVDE